jgi:hypothetical protein
MPFLQREGAPEDVPCKNKHPTLNEIDLLPKWLAPNPKCGETQVMPPPRPIHVKEDMHH